MDYNSSFKIDKNVISVNADKVYFIADIGANHDGSIDRARELINQAAYAGANAVKFQHFTASTIASDKGFKDLTDIKSHQSKWKKSVYETYKDASISLEWTAQLKVFCRDAGVDFFTSPYSKAMVDHIDPFVNAYKIGSGDITWREILEYISQKNKPVIIAAGASTLEEIDVAISVIAKHNKNISLLQCNTNYTGSEDNFNYINLRVLNTLKKKYPNLILGLSDHTPGHSTVLGAIALGARIIEKHFTDDNNRNGPDHKFAMCPVTWREMVDNSNKLLKALGKSDKVVEDNELNTVILQRRSIRLNRDLNANSTLTKEDLSCLRPCPTDAISPMDFDRIIGKKLTQNKASGDYLSWKDIAL